MSAPITALKGFAQVLEERLDFEIHLPLINVSPKGDSALTPRTEAVLRAHALREFELYDSLATAVS